MYGVNSPDAAALGLISSWRSIKKAWSSHAQLMSRCWLCAVILYPDRVSTQGKSQHSFGWFTNIDIDLPILMNFIRFIQSQPYAVTRHNEKCDEKLNKMFFCFVFKANIWRSNAPHCIYDGFPQCLFHRILSSFHFFQPCLLYPFTIQIHSSVWQARCENIFCCCWAPYVINIFVVSWQRKCLILLTRFEDELFCLFLLDSNLPVQQHKHFKRTDLQVCGAVYLSISWEFSGYSLVDDIQTRHMWSSDISSSN